MNGTKQKAEQGNKSKKGVKTYHKYIKVFFIIKTAQLHGSSTHLPRLRSPV